MKKFLYILACFALIIVSGFCFLGCDIIQGKSAYDIAVEQGFEGTVDEWLESLKGKDGEPGNDGKDFTGTGKSAYEIAVEQGFKGTVEEWLTSLKGQEGKPGENGTNGKNGQDGEDVSIKEIFSLAVEYGLYEDSANGYSEFLKDYFNSSLQTNDIAKVTNECLNSAVSIYCEDKDGNLQMGAGVFYQINTEDKYAYVITNYHVIGCEDEGYYQSDVICLYLYGTESLLTDNYGNLETYGNNAIMAEYIGGSAEYDLAVLKVSGDNFEKVASSSAKGVTIANTDNLVLGSTAIAIGNPMGSGTAVSSGIISCENENIGITIAGATRVLRCIRITTPINGGNSGGGLFNLDGELIGICNAKRAEFVYYDEYGNLVVDSYENVGYALHGSNVESVVNNIIDFYQTKNLGKEQPETVGVHKYLIGITITTDNPKTEYDENENMFYLSEDTIIVEVVKNGIADKLNIEIGDVIVGLKISDNVNEDRVYTISRRFQLLDAMLNLRFGDVATLTVIRTDAETGIKQQMSFEFVIEADGFKELAGESY